MSWIYSKAVHSVWKEWDQTIYQNQCMIYSLFKLSICGQCPITGYKFWQSFNCQMNSPKQTACLAKGYSKNVLMLRCHIFLHKAETGHRKPDTGHGDRHSSNLSLAAGWDQPLRDNKCTSNNSMFLCTIFNITTVWKLIIRKWED